MIKNWYSIYDNLGEQMLPPILLISDAVATRFFKDAVNNKNNDTIYNNPADYDLYKLGTFNEITGEIAADRHKIINGKAVKENE